MYRFIAGTFAIVALAVGTVGCCGTCCNKGGAGCPTYGSTKGYWRNNGQGHKVAGKACCRKCDLCCTVGGPCGGWSQTATAPAMGMDEFPEMYDYQMMEDGSLYPQSMINVPQPSVTVYSQQGPQTYAQQPQPTYAPQPQPVYAQQPQQVVYSQQPQPAPQRVVYQRYSPPPAAVRPAPARR